jgi:hypothetical protein
MVMPKKSEIKRALAKLEKKERTSARPIRSTPLEQFRFDLQQKFVTYKLKTQMSQRNMASILGTNEGKVSKILHNRLEEFSTDRLISFSIK